MVVELAMCIVAEDSLSSILLAGPWDHVHNGCKGDHLLFFVDGYQITLDTPFP